MFLTGSKAMATTAVASTDSQSPGDVRPTGVDGQRVSASGDLGDLGDGRVLSLVSEGGLGDGRGDGGALLAGDDQQRSAVRVGDVDLGIGERVEVGQHVLEERGSGRGHVVGVVEGVGLGLGQVVGPAVAEPSKVSATARPRLAGLRRMGAPARSEDAATDRMPRNGAASIATVTVAAPVPASFRPDE